MARLFNPTTVAAPLGSYSHGALVKAGSDLLFIAGQVGIRPDGTLPASLSEQAEQACSNIARILADAGMTPDNLVKLNTYVVQGQEVGPVRQARTNVFGDVRPASTLVFISQLVDPKYLVEVEAVAAR